MMKKSKVLWRINKTDNIGFGVIAGIDRKSMYIPLFYICFLFFKFELEINIKCKKRKSKYQSVNRKE